MTRKSPARLAREQGAGSQGPVTVNVEDIQKKQQAVLASIGSLHIQRENLENTLSQVNAQITYNLNLLQGLSEAIGQPAPPVPVK